MPLPRNSQSLPAVSWSGVWQITSARCKRSKIFFLLFEFTAPYAASRKQPISSGCFLEWRLADNKRKMQKKTIFFSCSLSGVLLIYKEPLQNNLCRSLHSDSYVIYLPAA
jgi:hypothetical protein